MGGTCRSAGQGAQGSAPALAGRPPTRRRAAEGAHSAARSRLLDLLLALLLALGAAAALRAGEAGPRVHALLHVPRHALLQRQGGRLTGPRAAPRRAPGRGPRCPPRLRHPGGPSAGRRGFAASHLPAGPAPAGAAGAGTPELQCLRPPPAGPSGPVQGPTEVSCSQRGDLGCQARAGVDPAASLRRRRRLSRSGRSALPGRVRGATQSSRTASPMSWPNGERLGCPLSLQGSAPTALHPLLPSGPCLNHMSHFLLERGRAEQTL